MMGQTIAVSVKFGVSLFLVEGLAMVTRFEAVPPGLPVRLLACHIGLVLLMMGFCLVAGRTVKVCPVSACILFLSQMILFSADRVFREIPVVAGIPILIALAIFLERRMNGGHKSSTATTFLVVLSASLLAKGSVLESGGWRNVLIASVWMMIAFGIIRLEVRYLHPLLSKIDRILPVSGSLCMLLICTWGLIYSGAPLEFQERTPGPGNNIVLIVLDTVRPECLSGFGSGEPLMKNLDQYARRHTLIPHMTAASPSSLPSHATLFTGLPSSVHGAHKPSPDDPNPPVYSYPLDGNAVTLAERLSEAGYTTAAVSGNYGPLSPSFGLDQGFDYYDAGRNTAYRTVEKTLFRRVFPLRRICGNLPVPVFGYGSSTPYRNAETITDRTLSVLNRLEKRPPFFLFINLFDAHSPYLPPGYWKNRRNRTGSDWIRDGEPLPSRQAALLSGQSELTGDEFRYLRDLYAESLVYVDDHLKRILDAVEEENTMVVILSDHGESLGEHDLLKHSNTLFREEIEVPCVVSLPQNGTMENLHEPPSSFADLHDLMLRAAGQKPPERPLEPGMISEVFNANHPIPESSGFNRLYHGDLKSLEQHPWKLIWHSDGRHQLFDLSLDGEYRDLASIHPDIAIGMADDLTSYLAAWSSGERSDTIERIMKSDIDALRALGYIQ